MKRQLSPWARQCKAQMYMLGKSLSDVSTDTGLSRSYISAIINERVVVPDATKEIVSKALGVEMDTQAADAQMV